MKIYKQAGEKIKKILKEKKLKQEILTKPLDINRSNVSRILSGKKVINLHECQVISKEVNVEFTINKNGVKVTDLSKK